MCGALNCAVDGCHSNGNKLRYSFKVLVLRNRKSVMSGAVRMACSAKVTVRSHRRWRERQSGRKSFIFNESRRRAPARAARRVLDDESVEESWNQLYGNGLWRGSAATNRNVEVLRLRGFQRTQSCKLWFRPHYFPSKMEERLII